MCLMDIMSLDTKLKKKHKRIFKIKYLQVFLFLFTVKINFPFKFLIKVNESYSIYIFYVFQSILLNMEIIFHLLIKRIIILKNVFTMPSASIIIISGVT
jgi:hypothetical protein